MNTHGMNTHGMNTQRSNARPTSDRRQGRDAGTALPLVLVMIVIGSLWVLPVMSYAMSVFRANSVLSDKTSRLEAVKAGLRVSLSDPVSLYEECGAGGPTVGIPLATTSASGVSVSTRCYYIDSETAQAADQLRLGLTATQIGKSAPAELKGNSYVPVDPLNVWDWQNIMTVDSETDKIWLPDLPVHALNQRAPGGYQMPTGYPACTVYFPGTYSDPLVLDGPAFFSSGIYYFENEVRVEGGATVTVGAGTSPGCATDQEAAFYAENAPSTHNISGLGGTWIFGDEGRLVVTNDNGSPIDFVFNSRYVNPEDTGATPSADVSIITVNGDLDVDGITGIELAVPDVIQVPLSVVGSEIPVPATSQSYLPSVYNPKPGPPEQIVNGTAQAHNGAVLLNWDAPLDGGSAITGYTVTASSGNTCTTNGATTCVVTGLSTSAPVSFVAVATNATGDSDTSDPSNIVTPSSSFSTLTAPAQPARPTATPYDGVARVTWTAPADGGAPITSYTVTASPGGESCVVDNTGATPATLECDIGNLSETELLGYTFTVVATNAIASSPASMPNLVPTIVSPLLGDPPPPPAPPVAPEYVPTAVVELLLADSAPVTMRVPGYVSMPQGRLHIDNPNGLDVQMGGGVLTAQFDVTDGRAAGPQSVPIGFLETVVQRKFRIESTTTEGAEKSTAVVQVNQNGAYAINSWEVQ